MVGCRQGAEPVVEAAGCLLGHRDRAASAREQQAGDDQAGDHVADVRHVGEVDGAADDVAEHHQEHQRLEQGDAEHLRAAQDRQTGPRRSPASSGRADESVPAGALRGVHRRVRRRHPGVDRAIDGQRRDADAGGERDIGCDRLGRRATTSRMRDAIGSASTSRVRGRSTTNSSPPIRAQRSTSRTTVVSASATSASSASPVACP